VELRLRREEREIAPRALVDPLGVLLVEGTAPRPLGAVLPEHVKLLRREALPPLGVGSGDLEGAGRLALARASEAAAAPKAPTPPPIHPSVTPYPRSFRLVVMSHRPLSSRAARTPRPVSVSSVRPVRPVGCQEVSRTDGDNPVN